MKVDEWSDNTAVVLDGAGRLAFRGGIEGVIQALEASRAGRWGPSFGMGEGSGV